MFPTKTDNFHRYVAPARASDGGLLLLGAALFLAMMYVWGNVLILGLIALWKAGGDAALMEETFGDMGPLSGDAAEPLTVILLLTTFFAMGGAVWMTARLFHDRGLASILGPRPWGPLVRKTSLIALSLLAISLVSAAFFANPQPNLPLERWLLWLPIALPLLVIQVSSEELIFRGYLMQELGARYTSPWIWMVLPSVIFGFLHLDVSTHGPNAWLVVLATSVFGVVAADITARVGSLIPAIVLHFFNNLLALFIVSLNGTINGMSLYVTEVHAGDTERVRIYLLVDIAFLLVLYIIWRIVWQRRSRLQSAAGQPT